MTVRVLALSSGTTSLESHRHALRPMSVSAGALENRSGIYPSAGAGDLSTVSAMVCAIAPLCAWVDGTSSSLQAGYILVSDAAVNITIAAGNASTVRTDRIIARIKDNPYDSSGSQTGTVEYLQGHGTTGAATALPASSLLLWEVTVPAGASAGGGGINFSTQRTDKRVYTVTAGGILPVSSQAYRDAISNAYESMVVYRTDLDALEMYDGSAWRTVNAIVASFAALSSVTNPSTGTLAFSTGDGILYYYNGSAWKFATPYRYTVVLSFDSQTVQLNIPSTAKFATVMWRGKSDQASIQDVGMRINGSNGGNYYGILDKITNSTSAISNFSGQTYAVVGSLTQGSTSQSGQGVIELCGWDNTTFLGVSWNARSHQYDSGANSVMYAASGTYTGTNKPFTYVQLFPVTGNFKTASEFTVVAWD